ncbi:ABC-2 type protein [Patulibacter medicamentivorans]|jgi:ABC transporter DrrB family efflux protein|uniref:Transport permease protein n=1 Tax=Patulibacter medicamentivorans TaxID=1097667 RepID=H0E7S8_9ACTN|nr:ABC transporter permease [Patulibacter medicamentivorans]EHN10262.1 ABC-2 type protein [Patulibacter medicamentivorans]
MSLATTFSDTTVLAGRQLRRIPRQPDLLIGFTIQPIMFVLLFRYVFGGAIQTPGFDNYAQFLMPGIIVQSIAFGGFVTALAVADDMSKGLMDRFRSLPMSRIAVLAGRSFADIVLNSLQLVLLIVVGLVVGFSFGTDVGQVVLGIVLLLMIGFAFSWVFALIGLAGGSAESANAIGFTVIFPLTFASGIFVPPATMPDGLREFANANPFTTWVDAVRHLFVGGPAAPANSDVWVSFLWVVGITIVAAFFAVRKYRNAVGH